jgi:hypothetical protein
MAFDLASLQSKGYFVQIIGPGPSEHTLLLECTMYFTDTTEDGTPTNPLCLGPKESILYEGHCFACRASLMESGVPSRPQKRGSILCPLCNEWTAPWSIRMRKYQGVFRVFPEEKRVDYIFPQNADSPGTIPSIRSKDMIVQISNVLIR